MRRASVQRASTISQHYPTRRLVAITTRRLYSSEPSSGAEPKDLNSSTKTPRDEPSTPKTIPHRKTMAELDAEMMEKMAGLAGDGGEAGVDYEDGKPAAMKRSVKNNMFRLI